jgi:hypothetical protein
MSIPNHLVRAVRDHRAVPFVGAGVSVGVKPGLFPSWGQLLARMADELESEARPDDAQKVRRLMEADNDYVGAAEWGLRTLGPYRFNRFLRGVFLQRRPSDLQTSVVTALWGLRAPLVITTNYDDVLRWLGPPDVQVVANDQPDELALMHEASPEWPWIWHLHGTIQRLSTVILAGSDYKALYSEKERAERYERAIFTLSAQLVDRPFLYVGFSLSDPYVLQQIADVLRLSKGKGVPSYALMKKGQGNAAALWENYNIQLVEYEDHGEPLAQLMRDLARMAFEAPPPSRAVESTARPAEDTALAPRTAIEEELGRVLLRSRRLLLLAPRRGGARTLGRGIARRLFGDRVTLLLPPNVPSCTEEEYFGAMAGDRSIDSFLKLERWLVERARAQGGGEHLVLVRHDGGPLEHLTTLGNALRRLIENPAAGPGAPRFCVLVTGESACAMLRFQSSSLSLFSGAPARHAPALTVEEVRAVIERGADARERVKYAADVHRVTGGLPGLVREVLMGEGSLEFEAMTERLAKSPSVRGALRMRLAEDDRAALHQAFHARTTLRALLSGKKVRRIEEVEDELKYPEVRLYYDGLVIADPGSGDTVFRCEAARVAAERTLALEEGGT